MASGLIAMQHAAASTYWLPPKPTTPHKATTCHTVSYLPVSATARCSWGGCPAGVAGQHWLHRACQAQCAQPVRLSHLRPARLPQNPIKLNMWRLLTEYTRGKACIAECLEFDSKLPVKVILIPRPGRGKPAGAHMAACRRYMTLRHTVAGNPSMHPRASLPISSCQPVLPSPA